MDWKCHHHDHQKILWRIWYLVAFVDEISTKIALQSMSQFARGFQNRSTRYLIQQSNDCRYVVTVRHAPLINGMQWMLIDLRRVRMRQLSTGKRKSRRKSLWEKTIGVKSTKNLLRPFVMQNKCNNIWPKAENLRIYHHRLRHWKILTSFVAHHAIAHSMKLPHPVTFQDVPAMISINRKWNQPHRPQNWQRTWSKWNCSPDDNCKRFVFAFHDKIFKNLVKKKCDRKSFRVIIH